MHSVSIEIESPMIVDGLNSKLLSLDYPKPVITQYVNPEKELEGILTRIQMEDLDDVAILVPSDKEVMMVNDYLAKNGVKTQVMYRTALPDSKHSGFLKQ